MGESLKGEGAGIPDHEVQDSTFSVIDIENFSYLTKHHIYLLIIPRDNSGFFIYNGVLKRENEKKITP